MRVLLVLALLAGGCSPIRFHGQAASRLSAKERAAFEYLAEQLRQQADQREDWHFHWADVTVISDRLVEIEVSPALHDRADGGEVTRYRYAETGCWHRVSVSRAYVAVGRPENEGHPPSTPTGRAYFHRDWETYPLLRPREVVSRR